MNLVTATRTQYLFCFFSTSFFNPTLTTTQTIFIFFRNSFHVFSLQLRSLFANLDPIGLVSMEKNNPRLIDNILNDPNVELNCSMPDYINRRFTSFASDMQNRLSRTVEWNTWTSVFSLCTSAKIITTAKIFISCFAIWLLNLIQTITMI